MPSELRLRHVTLPARDPEALARWYGRTFGLEVRGASATGRGALLVFAAGEPPGARGDAHAAHFGFAADSANAVAEWARRVGPHVAPLEQREDFASFRAADPEGNVFEITWDRRPFSAERWRCAPSSRPPRATATGSSRWRSPWEGPPW